MFEPMNTTMRNFSSLLNLPYVHEILERITFLQSGLYYTHLKPIPHVAYNIVFQNVEAFKTWNDHLGHPGVWMIRKL
jgi:hypothetical protein